MMRKVFLMLFVLMSFTAFSQLQVKEGSFKRDGNAVIDDKDEHYDDNYEPMALIKISTVNINEAERMRLAFKGNRATQIKKEYLNGQVWLYISKAADFLEISHPDYSLITYKLPETLCGFCVYDMTLEYISPSPSSEYVQQKKYHLIVKADQADATIYIDGTPMNIGEASKLVDEGTTHTYRIECDMYHAETGSVTVNEKTVINKTLRPAFGYINISTSPEQGAKVSIDGKYIGVSPITTDKLASGTHTVRVMKEMYKMKEQTFTVNDGQTTNANITMAANFVNVTVNTDSQSDIYVDEEYKGKGRWTGRLSDGSHIFEARKANHKANKKPIDFVLGKNETITLEAPKPINGSCEISSSPMGATIYIDGKSYGETPNYINEIIIGTHELKLEKQGCTTITKTISIKEGETLTVNEKLQTGKEENILIDDDYNERKQCYGKAISLLLPDVDTTEIYGGIYEFYGEEIDISKSEEAFSLFKQLASSGTDEFARNSMEMIVAMEFESVGCEKLGKYAVKMDMANYFLHNCYCPDIIKIKSGKWKILRPDKHNYCRTMSMYSESMYNWYLYKDHPYVNDKGSEYFHFIFNFYRPLTSLDLPYLIKKGNNYGFVDDNGKEVIECLYSFVYPFDNKSRLSAVRNQDYKWGFVDETGKTVIPHVYDIVNDVFVNGKNYVIKNDYLLLIDTRGNELIKFYGYNYLIPKLGEDEIIAYNALKLQFDVYDFDGTLLLEDCFSENNTKQNYTYDRISTYHYGDDVNDVWPLPKIPKEISYTDITDGDAVDLGIGVLWASKNVGSSSFTDMGKSYLWGDPECMYKNGRKNRSVGRKYEEEIVPKLPLDIAGTKYDIATMVMGEDWRLPKKEELIKLSEECIWEYCILDDCLGYRVIGKNGNSIFIPIEGEYYLQSFDEQIKLKESRQFVSYYSSERNDYYPIGLQMSLHDDDRFVNGASFWNYIRPVKNQ